MPSFPTNYRLVMLQMTANFLGRPFVLAGLIWTLLLKQFPKYYFAALYVFAIPVYWTVQVQYQRFMQKRDAASRGAIMAPEINGKWPGNIDLMAK